MAAKPKITPFLWFDQHAEEAANLYVSLFPGSRILSVIRYPEGSRAQPGSVMTVELELAGQRVVGLNGGPHFKLSEAFSFSVDCDGQEEVDRLWEALIADGCQPSQCGWLKDKFGLSWQIIPRQLGELLGDKDPAKAKRTMEAMLKMIKLDVAALQAAHQGR